MAAITYLVDLLILFVSLHAAIFFRLYLPLGSAVYSAPTISIRAYLVIFIAWGVSAFLRNFVSKRTRRGGQILGMGIVISILAVTEYITIGIENTSFSRLFLIFFVVANLGGSFVSWRLSLFLQENAKSISNHVQQLGRAINSINVRLRRYYAEVVAAFCVGVIWADYILKMGLTLTSDSIIYLGIAQKFTVSGIFQSGAWPPFYPLAISAMRFISQFPADGAAIISAASLAAFFVIFAFLLRYFSQNAIANILLILLLATFHDFIELFQNAWSEQLYTVFLAASFLLLVKHQFEHKWPYFLGAIIVAALAMVTRYIGVTIGGLVILYALLFAEPKIKFTSRLWKYVLPSLITFLPFMYLLWLDAGGAQSAGTILPGLAQVQQGAVFAYSLSYHSIVGTTVSTLSAFWGVAGLPYILIAFFLLLAIPFFRAWVSDQRIAGYLRLVLFFLAGYLILTIGVYLFTGPYLKTRYLAPPLFILFALIAQITGFITQSGPVNKKFFTTRVVFFAILIGALVYTLSLQSLGIENILVDRVRNARENPILHDQAGFDLSPTARGLSNFFEQISQNRDRNTVIVIEGDYNYLNLTFESDFRLARTFLFKGHVISSPRFSDFSFLEIRDQQQRLSYYFDAEYKELRLIIPTEKNLVETLNQLDQDTLDKDAVFLVVNEQWFSLFATEQLGSELERLKLFADIEPYLIFELRPVNPSTSFFLPETPNQTNIAYLDEPIK